MSNYVYIYLLKHPFLQEGYIGKSNNPSRRFKEHLRDQKITPKTDWFRVLQNNHLMPQMEILERVQEDKIYIREAVYIKQYIMDGWKIMNSTCRGLGCNKNNTL